MEWTAAALAAEPTAMPGSMSRVAHGPGELEFRRLAAQGLGVVQEFDAGRIPKAPHLHTDQRIACGFPCSRRAAA